MPSPSRVLTASDLTAARRAYEAGATFAQLAERHGVHASTLKGIARACGWPVRPRGRVPRPPEAPEPRPAVQVAPDARGRLRIPMRSREERRLRHWTAPERRAIEVEIYADRIAYIPRGRSAYKEGRRITPLGGGTTVEFILAMQRLRAAA